MEVDRNQNENEYLNHDENENNLDYYKEILIQVNTKLRKSIMEFHKLDSSSTENNEEYYTLLEKERKKQENREEKEIENSNSNVINHDPTLLSINFLIKNQLNTQLLLLKYYEIKPEIIEYIIQNQERVSANEEFLVLLETVEIILDSLGGEKKIKQEIDYENFLINNKRLFNFLQPFPHCESYLSNVILSSQYKKEDKEEFLKESGLFNAINSTMYSQVLDSESKEKLKGEFKLKYGRGENMDENAGGSERVDAVEANLIGVVEKEKEKEKIKKEKEKEKEKERKEKEKKSLVKSNTNYSTNTNANKENEIEKKLEEDLNEEIMGYAKSMKKIAKNFSDIISTDNIKLKEVEEAQTKGADSTKSEISNLDEFNTNDKISFWTLIKMFVFVFFSFILTAIIARLFPRFI